MAINLASKFSKYVDDAFARESLLRGATSDKVEFTGVNEVSVYSVDKMEMNDYVKSGTSRYGEIKEIGDRVQTFRIERDRSFTGSIDEGNAQDQYNVKDASARLHVQVRDVVIPETEAYVMMKWAYGAGKVVGGAAPTAETLLGLIQAGASHMNNCHVPRAGRGMFIAETYAAMLPNLANLTYLEKLGSQALTENSLPRVAGFDVHVVPDADMPAGVYFILQHKDACPFAQKLTKYKIQKDPMGIDGNVIVDNAGELVGEVSVLGNLDVKDKTDKTAAGTTDIGKLMIGAADYNYGTDVAASVSGTFSAKTVFVFSKAVLDDAAAAVVGDATVKSTEFYVEDALWMTAYDLGTVNGTAITNIDGVAQIKPEKLTNSTFGYWQTLEDGQYKQITDAKDVGDVDAVYAYVNYEIYTVTVFADPGIDAVYIDGKLMTSGVFRDPVNGMWAEGFQLNVAAGEHEITYKLGNYFSGEAKMTVNGTAVTGNAFTTSGTDPEDTQVTIYLQGIEASAPETPSTGGSSDDGMGLTDYLLIILVVLIVVMAIIVALRLMRS